MTGRRVTVFLRFLGFLGVIGLLSGCGLSDALLESPTTVAVIIEQSPNSLAAQSNVQFSVTCTKDDCQFFCALSSSTGSTPEFLPCPADFLYEGLSDDSYTFSVYAEDQQNQRSNTAEARFTVDTTAPELKLVSTPPALSSADQVSIAFTCDDANSCVTHCQLDDQPKRNCTSPFSIPSSEGSHQLIIIGVDLAGNGDTETATSVTWTSDLTPPQILNLRVDFGERDSLPGVTPDPYPDLTNSSVANFLFESSEENSQFECSLDDSEAVECESGYVINTNDTPDSGGGSLAPFSYPHDFFVRAIDAAGNRGDWTHYSWSVDNRAPVVTLIKKPEPESSNGTPEFTFSCDESTCNYECNLDGDGPSDQWTWQACTWPLVLPGRQGNVEWLPGLQTIPLGRHTFRVRVSDLAGNRSVNFAEHEWTVVGEWKQMTVSGQQVCAIDTQDELWCWGRQRVSLSLDDTESSPIYPGMVNISPGSQWRSIHGRFQTVCGTKFDGSYWCWGRNRVSNFTYPVTGVTSSDSWIKDPLPGAGGDWIAFKSSYVNSCGLKSDGSLWTIGNNEYRSLGQILPANSSGDVPSGTRNYLAIEAESNETWDSFDCYLHGCAIQTDGKLACWGYNYYGQLGVGTSGNGTSVFSPSFVEIPGLGGISSWKQVSVGLRHTCAIDYNDLLWCWGQNSYGQIASNAGSLQSVPFLIGNTTDKWKQVNAGRWHTCAVKTDGSLWCWGANAEGQLGLGSQSTTAEMGQVGTSTNWRSVHLGIESSETSCAMKTDDSIYCWGTNRYGQLADGRGDHHLPTKVGDGYSKVSLGSKHTCGITNSGAVNCWGSNQYGQLGNTTIDTGGSDFPRTSTPTPIMGISPQGWQDVALGYDYTLGIQGQSQTLYAWGRNTEGQLGLGLNNGDNITNDVPVPRRVPTSQSTRWDKIEPGTVHTCALANGDELWCWGSSAYGQLGTGSTGFTSELQRIQGNWSNVSAARYTSCGVRSSGAAECWGYNYYGQLGSGSRTTTPILTPIPVNSMQSWQRVSPSVYASCGITNAGELYCWGNNGRNEFGDSSYSSSYLPVLGGGSYSDWSEFSNARHGRPMTFCGLRGNAPQKTLWCWGNNQYSKLGIDDPSVENESAPIQVTTVQDGNNKYQLATGWKQIEVGTVHMCGVREDDSLWCWGSNGFGQLGHADQYATQYSLSPLRILRP